MKKLVIPQMQMWVWDTAEFECLAAVVGSPLKHVLGVLASLEIGERQEAQAPGQTQDWGTNKRPSPDHANKSSTAAKHV